MTLKQKLNLKPGQEAAWNAFANTGKQDRHHLGKEKMASRDEFAKLNTPQRLDKMIAMSDLRRAKLVERARGVKTFYAQLTPQQQNVFDAEIMHNRHQGRSGHHNHPDSHGKQGHDLHQQS